MSSLNNDNSQYPVLSSTLSTSVKTLNNNAVTNSNAQKSVNNAFATHFNNNSNDTFNIITDESFNTFTNQEFNQIFTTTQQTRFSAQAVKITLKVLDLHNNLKDSELHKKQESEIN